MENVIKNSVRWALVVLLMVMVGCAGSPEQVAVDESSKKQRLQYKQTPQLTVHELLYRAEVALSKDRLKVPKADNAFDWYLKVLTRNPLHQEARQGLDRISARYLKLAEQAMLAGEQGRAEVFIQRALSVTATPDQVKKLREGYRAPQFGDNEHLLDAVNLSKRNTNVQECLIELANLAQQANSRLLIVARNDSEGRWIYSQMRAGVSGYRLRGNIEIGRVPRVVLIDLKK
jgi:hypothetical protein